MYCLFPRGCVLGVLAALVPLVGYAFEPDHFLARPAASDSVAAVIPQQWAPPNGIRWKANLVGNGQSAPVVSDGIVYVTSIQGSMKEWCCVTAIDLESGTQLWTNRVAAATPIRANYFQCRAASTPVADQHGVVAFFETGNLVAFDRHGEVRWQKNLVESYGAFESTIGLAASLAQLDELAFVLVDHEGELQPLGDDLAKFSEARPEP